MRSQHASVSIPYRVAKRAATRYEVDGEHWVSTYSVASHGYPQIGWQDEGGRMRGTTAHRAAWVHHNGRQLNLGETVDHECKNVLCVRPDHLRALPNLENARRTSGRDWPVGTCRHGHGPEHWRPKGPTRAKGFCHACRMVRQRRKRGTATTRVNYV